MGRGSKWEEEGRAKGTFHNLKLQFWAARKRREKKEVSSSSEWLNEIPPPPFRILCSLLDGGEKRKEEGVFVLVGPIGDSVRK